MRTCVVSGNVQDVELMWVKFVSENSKNRPLAWVKRIKEGKSPCSVFI